MLRDIIFIHWVKTELTYMCIVELFFTLILVKKRVLGVWIRVGAWYSFTIIKKEIKVWPMLFDQIINIITLRFKSLIMKYCLFWLWTADQLLARSRDPTHKRQYSTKSKTTFRKATQIQSGPNHRDQLMGTHCTKIHTHPFNAVLLWVAAHFYWQGNKKSINH